MEFIKAPAFTRNLPDYLNDDRYRELQVTLAANPELGDLIPGRAGFARRAGRMCGAARAGEVGCGLFTTTSNPMVRYG